MLRKLGSNGFLDRSLATRRQLSVPLSARYIHNYGYNTTPHTARLLSLRSHVHIHTRLASTKPTTSTSESNNVPPDSTSLRKHKVDLKPGPIKSAPSNKASNPPEPPPLPTSSTPSTSKSSPNSSGASVSDGMKEAKLDIIKAQQQGVLQPPPENYGRIKKLIHQAKELFKFYWNGLKQINKNRLEVAAIRQRIKDGGEPMSRAEFRFIETYKQDALKLIPFLLIVLTLEELIPVIAIYAPFMLPSTTIFPSQLARIEAKAQEKQLKWSHHPTFSSITQPIGLAQLRTLGGHKPIAGILRLATWGPGPLVLWRIDKHLKFLEKDDELISKEKLGQSLRDGEVKKALEERGVIAHKLNPDQARQKLKQWLLNVSSSTASMEGDAISKRVYAVAKANV